MSAAELEVGLGPIEEFREAVLPHREFESWGISSLGGDGVLSGFAGLIWVAADVVVGGRIALFWGVVVNVRRSGREQALWEVN